MFIVICLIEYLLIDMDRIISYLPDNVHVTFGWEKDPAYYGAYPETTYSTIVIPKNWIKHNKRGSWNEWEIKKTFKNKLASQFGEEYLHSTKKLQVIEWNQLENVAMMIKKANNIGFSNILEIAKTIDPNDVIYTHSIGY